MPTNKPIIQKEKESFKKETIHFYLDKRKSNSIFNTFLNFVSNPGNQNHRFNSPKFFSTTFPLPHEPPVPDFFPGELDYHKNHVELKIFLESFAMLTPY